MDSDDIYDKSIWPLFTPGMHWALSDDVRYIGKLSKIEDDSIEYSIRSYNIPEGEDGLWHINALRDITFNLTDMSDRHSVESVTLCLGDKALQCVKVLSTSNDVVFSMFSDTNILPLFVFDEDVLSVSVQFKESLSLQSKSNFNPKAIHAKGLFVRIKEKHKPFFVAGSKDSVLTWDGQQSHVYSRACVPRSFMADSFDTPDLLKEARDEIVRNDDSTYLDLWNVLKLRKDPIWSSDSPLSDALDTPRNH